MDFSNLNEYNFNPMNDVIFKFIFGKEERKHITIDFLNAILADDLGHTIKNIRFEQTEMSPNNDNDKLTRLDVACTLDSGEIVDVEVQVVNYKNMQRRTLYYWAQMYLMNLASGHDYGEIKPVITINILHFNLFDDDAPHSVWSVCNLKTGQRLSRDLTLHFLEVPKYATIANKPIAKMSKMERWLTYFANKLDNKGREELAMNEPAINDAVSSARTFFNTPSERRHYINREMAIMDYNANMEGAKKEGREEGEKSGREKERMSSIRALMKNAKISAEKAMELLGIDKSLWSKYSAML